MKTIDIPMERASLFLDLDGTLAPFAPTPGEVVPDAGRSALLRRAGSALGGRLAIISGLVGAISAGAGRVIGAMQGLASRALASAKATLGIASPSKEFMKLGAFVASTPDFTDQPKVANGASELLFHVLGAAGKHARSAVGVAALPLGAAVEVDAIVAVSPH